jgi:hypothetical protein
MRNRDERSPHDDHRRARQARKDSSSVARFGATDNPSQMASRRIGSAIAFASLSVIAPVCLNAQSTQRAEYREIALSDLIQRPEEFDGALVRV